MRILELAGSGEVGMGVGKSAPTVITELCNAFSTLGHTVTLMDTEAAGPRHTLDRRVELLEVGTPSPFRRTQQKLPRAFVWARNHMHRLSRMNPEMVRHRRFIQACNAKVDFRRYDIVHTHHGKQAYFLSSHCRARYAYTSHWAFEPEDKSFNAEVERKIVNEAQLAVGLGDYLRVFAPNANISVIPHGLDVDHWRPINRRAARSVLGYTDDDFVLLYVGAIKWHKGLDILIDAFIKLVSRIGRLKLVAIGPLGEGPGGRMGRFAGELVERARGHDIAFPGQVGHCSLEHRLRLAAADLFVFPSRTEAQGLAALEAMAMSTPVVAANVGGLAEMVADDIGRKIPPGDSDALAEAILSLQRNPHLLTHLRENCRPYVEQNYTWLGVAKRYISAFESCLANRCR